MVSLLLLEEEESVVGGKKDCVCEKREDSVEGRKESKKLLAESVCVLCSVMQQKLGGDDDIQSAARFVGLLVLLDQTRWR